MEIDYDTICKYVGHIVLQSEHDKQKIIAQVNLLGKELKNKVLEKDKTIKELQEELAILKGRNGE